MRKGLKALCICVIVVLIAIFAAMVLDTMFALENYKESEYVLSEIGDGVYGIYTVVSSSVPANNYEMVTLCCNGTIFTFKGDVTISFTDGNPRVIFRDYNIVNSDDIFVYVPEGTIKFQENVGLK